MKKILNSAIFILLITSFGYSQVNYIPNVIVSDFWGGPLAGFGNPSHIAMDKTTGNLYVTDQTNGTNQIRKITPDGFVTTFAVGFYCVTVDAFGNIYAVGNNTISKISQSGTATVFAGSPVFGKADGQGTAASFFQPSGLSTDASGNIYVADLENDLIRKITPSGLVSTFAGSGSGSIDGQGTAASFNYPTGLAVDPAGNVFVADQGNNLIRKITPSGLVSTFAGSGVTGSANGQGIAASFWTPKDITVDNLGNVYVSTYNCLIRKITSSGLVSTFAGTGVLGSADGQGTAASFNSPAGLSVDLLGNIFVADNSNNNIRKITPSGLVSTLAGSTLAGGVAGDGKTIATSCSGPSGVAVDASGNFYIVDTGNNIIRKITPAGIVTTLAGSTMIGSTNGQGTTASFNYPIGLAVDPIGNVYISDQGNNLIRKITPSGLVSTLAGSTIAGSSNGQGTAASFNSPAGLSVDLSGNVYVADQGNNLIRKITPSGLVSTFAGSMTPGDVNGQGIAARFRTPTGVAVDALGNVYVADYDNYMIRKITSGGVVSWWAGGTTYGNTDGEGSTATFRRPAGVALDGSGNLYVTDDYSNTVRLISPTGLVSTLAGEGINRFGNLNGKGDTAIFSQPNGIAVDFAGNVYVADAGNDIIRKLTIGNQTATATLNNIKNSSIILFPNPANDVLNIDSSNIIDGTLLIMDIHGSLLLTQPISGSQAQVSTTFLQNGMYVIKIISNNTTYVSQVVIAR